MNNINKKRNQFLIWLPLCFSLIFGVLAVSLHHIACPTVIKSVYFQAPLYALVPLVFPVLERYTNIRIPGFLIVVITIQIIISVDLGTALNFYAFIPYYDKLLHTFFGVWAAQLMWYFFGLGAGERSNAALKALFVTLAVLGIAALWEVSEYFMSLVLGTDPQLWKQVLTDPTYHPLADTIWDIIVAFFGICIFYLTLLADRLLRGRLYRGSLNPAPRIHDGEGEHNQ